MVSDWKHAILGRTGLAVGRLGLSSGYGSDAKWVERAFERGVNYFYWGSLRRPSFAAGLRNLRSQRDKLVIVVQSYTRVAALLPWSVERALKAIGTDHADVLLLGMWNKDVTPAILERAVRMRERGLVRHLGISTHNRVHGSELVTHGAVDVLHMRYNAIHPGAEREIFPMLGEARERPGIVSFTATSWGQLLKPDKVPAGERVPTAADCYRFVLTNENIDLSLIGPSSLAQLEEALGVMDAGPMSAEELSWMRRVGQAKYSRPSRLLMRT